MTMNAVLPRTNELVSNLQPVNVPKICERKVLPFHAPVPESQEPAVTPARWPFPSRIAAKTVAIYLWKCAESCAESGQDSFNQLCRDIVRLANVNPDGVALSSIDDLTEPFTKGRNDTGVIPDYVPHLRDFCSLDKDGKGVLQCPKGHIDESHILILLELVAQKAHVA